MKRTKPEYPGEDAKDQDIRPDGMPEPAEITDTQADAREAEAGRETGGAPAEDRKAGGAGTGEEHKSGKKASAEREAEDRKDIQIRELSDKFLRLAAEYDNFRKRTQREKESLYADSVLTVSAAWLPVLDNLERGIEAAGAFDSEEARSVAAGMAMVVQQARDVLAGLGIREIEALGRTFDPSAMHAILHTDDENAGENEVVQVLVKGYARDGKVIRHAQVKVAN